VRIGKQVHAQPNDLVRIPDTDSPGGKRVPGRLLRCTLTVDLADLGFSDNPTILAAVEFEAVA